jgi:hypothetical protein
MRKSLSLICSKTKLAGLPGSLTAENRPVALSHFQGLAGSTSRRPLACTDRVMRMLMSASTRAGGRWPGASPPMRLRVGSLGAG